MKRSSLALLCSLCLALPAWAGPPTRSRSYQVLDMGRNRSDATHRIVAPIHGGTRLDIRLRSRARGLTTEEGLHLADRLDEVNRRLSSVLEPPTELCIEVDRARRLADFAWEGDRIVGAMPGGSSEDVFLAPLLREYGRAYFMHNLRLKGGRSARAKGRLLELAGPYGDFFGELLAQVFVPTATDREPSPGAMKPEGLRVGVPRCGLERDRLRSILGQVMGRSASSAGAARVAAAAFRVLAEEAGRAVESDGGAPRRRPARGREILQRIRRILHVR